MDAFEICELISRQERGNSSSLEFLRVPALSLSLYHLPAGGSDPQQPHSEDEAYYVVRGRAIFRAGEEERAVQPGTVLFVRVRVEHRFHSIREDLVLLVVFAPAEGTQAVAVDLASRQAPA